jgi:hypothetical protein
MMIRFKTEVQRIPFPGSSGERPSGPMQFDDDWPGLFIRGDDCIRLVDDLERLQKRGVELGWALENLIEVVRNHVIIRESP